MSERIEKLKQAVEKRFEGEARWLQSIPVKVEHKGIVNWEGIVEVFRIPETNRSVRCYAWESRKKTDVDYVTVPEIMLKKPPRPMTAVEAVQFWLASLNET